MSLSGSFQDFHKIMYKDTLAHELQQKGSLLLGTVEKEKVEGVKTQFTKLGKLSSGRKQSRNQLKDPQTPTFERRQINFEGVFSDIQPDVTDTLDMVMDPSGQYVVAMRDEMGRQIDDIILEALKGSATVIANGSSSSTALPAGSKVAVNTSKYGNAAAADVALTAAKLKEAIAMLKEDHVDIAREPLFCIAPAAQLMNLATEAEVVSRDYRGKETLETLGAIPGLNGFLGITFIAFEDTGVDSNNDELAFVYPKSAVKVGIRKDLDVSIDRDFTKVGNPDIISAFMDLGAVRMFEEKVIQIACDPR